MMKVNNDKFNKFLEEEKKIKYEEKNHGYYEAMGETFRLYIQRDWLIGLMTQFLLDNGLCLEKFEDSYYVYDLEKVTLSKDENLFTALKDAIEGMQE